MFYAIYMATRPRARACIFHKTLGLMLYLLHTPIIPQAQCASGSRCILACTARGRDVIIYIHIAVAVPNESSIANASRHVFCFAQK